MKFKVGIIIFVILLFAVACQQDALDAPALAYTAVTETVTQMPQPMSSPTETLTKTVSATITNTNTPKQTATKTLTSTATPFLGFEKILLNNAEQLNGQTMFIFSLPGVGITYYYAEASHHNFECKPDEKYPDLLFCTSAQFPVKYGYLLFNFYEDREMTKLIHSGEFHTGMTSAVEPTPEPFPINWAGPETWCEERGKNISCETEYRLYHDEPCIASTCYDGCGWYYSIDTCPYDSDNFLWIPKPTDW